MEQAGNFKSCLKSTAIYSNLGRINHQQISAQRERKNSFDSKHATQHVASFSKQNKSSIRMEPLTSHANNAKKKILGFS
jgi:hypothetical protein